MMFRQFLLRRHLLSPRRIFPQDGKKLAMHAAFAKACLGFEFWIGLGMELPLQKQRCMIRQAMRCDPARSERLDFVSSPSAMVNLLVRAGKC